MAAIMVYGVFWNLLHWTKKVHVMNSKEQETNLQEEEEIEHEIKF